MLPVNVKSDKQSYKEGTRRKTRKVTEQAGLGVSPYLHLRRDGQSPHLHGQPRLADLDELVEAERLLEVLPRRVRLPLLLGCQRRRLQHSHTRGSQGSQGSH